mgnify:CR=1 FL=1
MFLKGKLWTGDKILTEALRKKGFTDVVNTKTIFKLFKKFENLM